MTTIEYLQQINRLDRQIKNKILEIDQYRDMACSLKGISNEERVQSSPITFDKIGNSVAKLIEMEKECDAMIDAYVDRKEKIIDEINSIEDENEFDVLFLKFVDKNNSFSKIANEINKSLRQTMRIYDKALSNFEKKFGENYLDA